MFYGVILFWWCLHNPQSFYGRLSHWKIMMKDNFLWIYWSAQYNRQFQPPAKHITSIDWVELFVPNFETGNAMPRQQLLPSLTHYRICFAAFLTRWCCGCMFSVLLLQYFQTSSICRCGGVWRLQSSFWFFRFYTNVLLAYKRKLDKYIHLWLSVEDIIIHLPSICKH